jgi:hypothetical protein
MFMTHWFDQEGFHFYGIGFRLCAGRTGVGFLSKRTGRIDGKGKYGGSGGGKQVKEGGGKAGWIYGREGRFRTEDCKGLQRGEGVRKAGDLAGGT